MKKPMPDLISALLLISWVNLGKLPNLSGPQLPGEWNEGDGLDDFQSPFQLWRFPYLPFGGCVELISVKDKMLIKNPGSSWGLPNQWWEENNSSHPCICLLAMHLGPHPLSWLQCSRPPEMFALPPMIPWCQRASASTWESWARETRRLKRTGNLASAQLHSRQWVAVLWS